MRLRAVHASTFVGRTKIWFVVAGNGEAYDEGRVSRQRVDLLEVDRSGFEKTISKNFNKGAE
jgi:hypothetical protein